MIGGGWPFVWGAYALTLLALVVLTFAVVLRLAYWSRRSRESEPRP
ncbi:MAG TPA: heme exporter protein CcmD [Candidatus Binatia bacterium]|nr:heme exporter protein CcmD [Candidatus Binatia bacterium]